MLGTIPKLKNIYPLNKHNQSSIKCRNIKHNQYKLFIAIIATIYAFVASLLK